MPHMRLGILWNELNWSLTPFIQGRGTTLPSRPARLMLAWADSAASRVGNGPARRRVSGPPGEPSRAVKGTILAAASFSRAWLNFASSRKAPTWTAKPSSFGGEDWAATWAGVGAVGFTEATEATGG